MREAATRPCPDCDAPSSEPLDRRSFLESVSLAGTAAISSTLWAVPRAAAAPSPTSAAETVVKALHKSLTPAQKKAICFDWDFKHPERGLLRTHVSNFWHINNQRIAS